MNDNPEPGRVIGIGGVFFKSADKKALEKWYLDQLGFPHGPAGFCFPWRAQDAPDTERMTVWSIFPRDSAYFDPSKAPFMINYIVDDMDALLAKLARAGVAIDPKREDHDYGRFAWIHDPDGNKIELWQPL